MRRWAFTKETIALLVHLSINIIGTCPLHQHCLQSHSYINQIGFELSKKKTFHGTVMDALIVDHNTQTLSPRMLSLYSGLHAIATILGNIL